MAAESSPVAPGIYRFTVRSTDQAVTLVRERLGANARVVGVRAVPETGWRRLLGGTRLEVTAQVDAASGGTAALDVRSTEPAEPAGNESDDALAAASDAATAAGPREPARERPCVRRGLKPLPPSLGLAGLLRRSGITETALSRIQSGPNWPELSALPLHRALAETSRLLRSQAEARVARPPVSRAAFVGSAGVGRTTALCKWLAQDVFRRARTGHVVGVEFDRPNPLGPLPVFAEALGVPLAHFPCATQPAVPGGFAYLDLPALSPRRPQENRRIASFLDTERIAERVLVLHAAYDRQALHDAYAAGRDVGATHLVFTHLDEVAQWGKLWDFLFDEEIEPLFLSTGPSLTGDCEEDVSGAIVRRTLPDNEP
jgi:flagellar biosynthesis protein FlhF